MQDYERYRQAAHMVERGWVQSAWHTSEGVCMMTALVYAFGGHSADSLPARVGLEVAGEINSRRPRRWRKIVGSNMGQLVAWNDHLDRRQGEVLSVLHAIANRLERESYLVRIANLEAEVRALKAQNESLNNRLSTVEIESELDDLYRRLKADEPSRVE